jgi:hypothetical protein
MRNKRSRLALFGVLALALSVTVGPAVDVAAGQKKGKKGARTFTAAKTAPTIIPAAISLGGGNVIAGRVDIPLTVGKKAKGKVVGFDTVSATHTLSAGAVDVLDDIDTSLLNPKRREVGLITPQDGNTIFIGPLTQTPNSDAGVCVGGAAPPPPPCPNPGNTLGPPYAGTVGNNGLVLFNGGAARGTWFYRFLNFNPAATATANSVKIEGNLIPKAALTQ